MARFFRSATGVITALTALATLAVWATGPINHAAAALGFIPARISGAETPWASVPALLTPLTTTIVHANSLHLFVNLIMFAWCGKAVEKALGSANLVIIYAVGAYVAEAGQWLSDPHSIVPTIGAGGAISAILAAFAISFGKPRMFTKSIKLNRWLHIAQLLVAWIVIQVMIDWVSGDRGFHLFTTPAYIAGGYLAGLLLQRPLLLWKFRHA